MSCNNLKLNGLFIFKFQNSSVELMINIDCNAMQSKCNQNKAKQKHKNKLVIPNVVEAVDMSNFWCNEFRHQDIAVLDYHRTYESGKIFIVL
jgi:hypothetical protein